MVFCRLPSFLCSCWSICNVISKWIPCQARKTPVLSHHLRKLQYSSISKLRSDVIWCFYWMHMILSGTNRLSTGQMFDTFSQRTSPRPHGLPLWECSSVDGSTWWSINQPVQNDTGLFSHLRQVRPWNLVCVSFTNLLLLGGKMCIANPHTCNNGNIYFINIC